MLIGYARVSTCLQDTALQLDALSRYGVQRVYQEKISGTGARPALQRCINSLKPGDVLIVWRLDRVARSLKDLLNILERIKAAGADIKSITEPLDTGSALGTFMIQILGAVAELEKNIIRERAIAGLVAAHKKGVKLGQRKCNLKPEEVEAMRKLYNSGNYSMTEIGRMFGVTGTTVYRRCSPSYHREKMPVLSKYLSQEFTEPGV